MSNHIVKWFVARTSSHNNCNYIYYIYIYKYIYEIKYTFQEYT